jgi:TonB family protein
MFSVRLLFVIAIGLTFWLSQAITAEKTTAIWSDGHSAALSDEELTRYAVYWPGAAYPEEAQKAKTAGSGLYELRINKAGATTEVVSVKSSGSAVLDDAAKETFRKLRFGPAIFTRVRVPARWSVDRLRWNCQ